MHPDIPVPKEHQQIRKQDQARASLVAENVSNLVVDNYQVLWPTDSIPSDWIIPVHVENSTNRRFDSTNYNHLIPRQTEFSVILLRNVYGGYV